ncbi:hypothetical protein HDU76_002761 [Blyttiomyces sp. JEL0837]|nr:hypothetical protein HDU76_002761 [Blyttiomyces sp. JEL0837]
MEDLQQQQQDEQQLKPSSLNINADENAVRENSKKPRKSLGRRVSFANFAKVRMFDKDGKENFGPLSPGVGLGDVSTYDGKYEMPDLSSVRRNSNVFNLSLSPDASKEKLSKQESPEHCETSFEVELKGGSDHGSPFQDRRDSVAPLFESFGADNGFGIPLDDSDSDVDMKSSPTVKNIASLIQMPVKDNDGPSLSGGHNSDMRRRDSVAAFFEEASEIVEDMDVAEDTPEYQQYDLQPPQPNPFASASRDSDMRRRDSVAAFFEEGSEFIQEREIGDALAPAHTLDNLSPSDAMDSSVFQSIDESMELVDESMQIASDLGQNDLIADNPDENIPSVQTVMLVDASPITRVKIEGDGMEMTTNYGNILLSKDMQSEPGSPVKTHANITKEPAPSLPATPRAMTPRVQKLLERSLSAKKSTPKQFMSANMRESLGLRRIGGLDAEISSPVPEIKTSQKALDDDNLLNEHLTMVDESFSENNIITLNDFLQATGTHFIDGLTTTLRRETNAFARNSEQPSALDYTRAACLLMPELYSFEVGCKALTDHIEEGRQSMRIMEAKISKNTPPLFVIYADASEQEQERLLKDLRNIHELQRFFNEAIFEASGQKDYLIAEIIKLKSRHELLKSCDPAKLSALTDQAEKNRVNQLYIDTKSISSTSTLVTSMNVENEDLKGRISALEADITTLRAITAEVETKLKNDVGGLRDQYKLLTSTHRWTPTASGLRDQEGHIGSGSIEQRLNFVTEWCLDTGLLRDQTADETLRRSNQEQ